MTSSRLIKSELPLSASSLQKRFDFQFQLQIALFISKNVSCGLQRQNVGKDANEEKSIDDLLIRGVTNDTIDDIAWLEFRLTKCVANVIGLN